MKVIPGADWKKVPSKAGAGGYLSTYYSDDLSAIPVRWVTKPGDNKGDPNVETQTYGLFTSCNRRMRKSMIDRGLQHLFFATRWKGERSLAGYYRVAAYADPAGDADYALLANSLRFVANPTPIALINAQFGTSLSATCRSPQMLDSREVSILRGILQRKPNALDMYVSEAHRLERFSAYHTGYRYSSWKREAGFDWPAAESYIEEQKGPRNRLNSTITGRWECLECGKIVVHKGYLRRCPECGKARSLVAE